MTKPNNSRLGTVWLIAGLSVLVIAFGAIKLWRSDRTGADRTVAEKQTLLEVSEAESEIDWEREIDALREWSPETGFDMERYLESIRGIGSLYHARIDELSLAESALLEFESAHSTATPERAERAAEIDELQGRIAAHKDTVVREISGDDAWLRLSETLAEADEVLEQNRLALNAAMQSLFDATRARTRHEHLARTDAPERVPLAARLDALRAEREQEQSALVELIGEDPEWARLDAELARLDERIASIESGGNEAIEREKDEWKALWAEYHDVDNRKSDYFAAARRASADRLVHVAAISEIDAAIRNVENELRELFSDDPAWALLEADRVRAENEVEAATEIMREASLTARKLRRELAAAESRAMAERPAAAAAAAAIEDLKESIAAQELELSRLFEHDSEWQRLDGQRLAAETRRDEYRERVLEMIRARMRVEAEMAQGARRRAEGHAHTDG